MITFLLVLIIDFNQVGRQFGLVEGVAVSQPFSNCAAARAMGADPVYRHESGYGPHLDGDRDGIGCEPPRR
ncbi:MAG TPA: excalibur calcium-binding domain-containing protein [Allosphingosinicella sp.]